MSNHTFLTVRPTSSPSGIEATDWKSVVRLPLRIGKVSAIGPTPADARSYMLSLFITFVGNDKVMTQQFPTSLMTGIVRFLGEFNKAGARPAYGGYKPTRFPEQKRSFVRLRAGHTKSLRFPLMKPRGRS